MSDGCGGLTGVTPLTRYRAWVVEQAAGWGVRWGISDFCLVFFHNIILSFCNSG